MWLDTDDNTFVGGKQNVSANLLTKYNLFVKKGVLTEDIAIGAQQFWSDYVFESDYKLAELFEVEDFIKQNKRLPNIPSQKTISKEGYNMHEMNILFLEKIEELTLYTIEQQKLIESLKEEVETLKKVIIYKKEPITKQN